jgi:uncharacterized Zn finger protein (UPF0148 family)
MQFIAISGHVECPACGITLRLISEQDQRVATMKHDGDLSCTLRQRMFHVDRNTGYGEQFYEA